MSVDAHGHHASDCTCTQPPKAAAYTYSQRRAAVGGRRRRPLWGCRVLLWARNSQVTVIRNSQVVEVKSSLYWNPAPQKEQTYFSVVIPFIPFLNIGLFSIVLFAQVSNMCTWHFPGPEFETESSRGTFLYKAPLFSPCNSIPSYSVWTQDCPAYSPAGRHCDEKQTVKGKTEATRWWVTCAEDGM